MKTNNGWVSLADLPGSVYDIKAYARAHWRELADGNEPGKEHWEPGPYSFDWPLDRYRVCVNQASRYYIDIGSRLNSV